jgi:Zn-dependent protease
MDPGIRLVSLQFFITFTAFLIAVSFHECAHALVAYLLGDSTAKNSGRLTLNPLAHLDLFGILFLLTLGIGWATPVPIDERNFRYPRIFSIITGLAGPFSNLLLALGALYVLHYFGPCVAGSWHAVFVSFGRNLAYINTMLAVFNAIPLPPLDGSHLIRALLPRFLVPAYYTVARFSIVILLLLLMYPPTYGAFRHAIESTYDFLECLVI